MKQSNSYKSLVKCPFCDKQVPSKKLADHAKSAHAGQNSQSVKSDSKSSAPLEKVESTKPVIPRAGNYFIDPSGFLVSTKLIREEIKINGDDQPRGVTRGHSKSKRRFAKAKKSKSSVTPTAPAAGGDNRPSRPVDDSFREKVEWLNRLSSAIKTANSLGPRDFRQCPVCKVAVKLKRLKKHIATVHPGVQLPEDQIEAAPTGKAIHADRQGAKNIGSGWKQTQVSAREFRKALKKQRETKVDSFSTSVDKVVSDREANLVKCPLCKHRAAYNVLFVHIQVGHPEVNPKVVMSKFNRVNRRNDHGNLSRYQKELNELVKDYERLKQGLDEPRDGGKYMGHMRREHGRFGSLPLYDDYSDESDAK